MPKKPVQLWPDFAAEPRPRTVRRILLEAGVGLAEQTDEQVHFVVDTTAGEKKGFTHNCYLVAPALSYRYPLCRVPLCRVTENGDPYPVILVGDPFPKGTSAKNEEAFTENLRQLFHADATKRTVLNLLDAIS